MKKSIFLFFAAILYATNAWAWCGNSFITVNGLWCTGSNSYVHTGGKFHGKDLGTLTTLVLGGELQVYPKSSSAASLCYKIDDGNEGTISLPKTGEEGNNSKHSGSGDVDLSALSEGEHTIAVWFKHNSDYDSNDSQNFVASFTIANEAPDRYITGTLAGGWNGNEVKMTYDKDTKKYSHTFTNVAAGEEYKFKVTDGTWTLHWGGAAVSPAIDGVTTDGDGNAKFTLATAGDVTITFDGSKIQLSTTGTLKVPQSYDYYILGTMNAWTVEEEYGFTDEDKDGVYTREITLAAGEHFFKINVGNWDSQWGWSSVTGTYQEATDASDDNKIKITLESEKTFTVLFNSTTKKITFEGLTVPTPTYTVTVSAENGSVEGLENEGVYEEGASVTLTATAADGYEFVNWTVAGEEVSTENPYTFVVSADVALVANFKKAVEEYTITLSGLLKYTNDWRGYTTLQNEEGDTAFFVYNYVDGVPAYGEDYTVTANLGELTLEGTGSWKLIDELETITAVLYNEERTAVYNVTVSAKAPEVHNLACTDALYVENISEWMSELIITGVIDEDALTISVYDWKEATAGTYYQVTGVLNDEVYIQPESAVVTIVDTKLTIVFSAKDELGNTYNVNVTATPKPNTPLVVENATFTVDGDNLTIQGQWETKSVVVALVGWSTTKYGEYNNAVLMTGTGDADDDIYAEFSAVLSKDGTTATLTGVAANWDGTKYDVTISGLAPAETPTALDNVDTTVAPAKVINNGQLIIIRNGVQYNAQGAVVK